MSQGQGVAAPRHPIAVELRGITKTFPGVVANSDVNLVVRSGTVHAVVGENGAGKSTLMKTLYGMHRPDAGTILIDGREVVLRSPADAIARAVGMVHQHFMLADNFTVLENVVLGDEPTRRGWLDFAAARAKIAATSQRYGLGVDPDALVADLGVGDRQRVEILKVLYRGARILILDEPTAVLVPQEVDALFAALAELKAQGMAVIFISHKLDEVIRVADDITVIRRGTTVATVDPAAVSPRSLANLMVGSQLPAPPPREAPVRSAPGLELAGVSVVSAAGRALLSDIDLRVFGGEVVGIAGVEGNGQAELVAAILGVVPVTGSITIAGRDATRWSTRRRRESGLSVIPEDRNRQGLVMDWALWENRMLGQQTRPPNARGPLLDIAGARADTARIVAECDVRTPGIEVLAGALSGGNQQKLLVGRELSGEPRVLIAAHPTRGVDVGAQASIWEMIRHARAAGVAVLLISADLDELIGLSDGLCVMLRGRIVARLDPSDVTPAELGSAMTGAEQGGQA